MSARLLLLSVATLLLTVAPASPAADEPTADTPERSANEQRSRESSDEPSEARGDAVQLRLDEITIEGEVDVPRVLFIESRDRLRRAGFLHHLFLPDVAELGREAPLGHGLTWTPQGEIPTWTP